MKHPRWLLAILMLLSGLAVNRSLGQHEHHEHHEHGKKTKPPEKGRAPEELPRTPPPDARAAYVPAGYRVEIVAANLSYPTSIAFDDAGTMYVAEGGYIYGDDVAPARVLRFPTKGQPETVADQLNGPVTDLMWHGGRLYISHRGKISVLEANGIRDLVTGLPSLGDHHNNQMSVGPDGRIYFGQGTATNSGVVGLDNLKLGWLAKYPEVRDIPPKDIRISSQPFSSPDFLSLLSGKPEGHGKGMGHEGHDHKAKDHDKKKGHAGHEGHDKKPAKDDKKKESKHHEGHEKKSAPAPEQKKDKGHEHHDTKPKGDQKAKEHEGHDHKHGEQKGKGHAGHDKMEHHKDGHEGHRMVKTYGFQPFGKTPPDEGAVRGSLKANGVIFRIKPDGSSLEVFAWGLRNPYGLCWTPDGKLYSSDNGYDERGSRPIAHAPDCLWEIKQGAWYGFPDYAAGVPITDARFRPEHGPAPKFLMRDHPMVETPLVSLPHHVGAAGMNVSRGSEFGFKGHLFLALAGDMNPITGVHEKRTGFAVVRIDPKDAKPEVFFQALPKTLGPQGLEYVTTAGPKRPVSVRFSPGGEALYVVDIGAMAILSTATGPAPRPFPRTGAIWRITRVPAVGQRSNTK